MYSLINYTLLEQYPILDTPIAITEAVFHPLVEAAQVGDLMRVKHILPNADQPNIGLAVHWAAYNKHIACLQYLVQHADIQQNSWAMIAAASEGCEDIVGVLLPFSEPKTANSLALRLALNNNHWDCVSILKDGSDPSPGCGTALLKAVEHNDMMAFKNLLPFARMEPDINLSNTKQFNTKKIYYLTAEKTVGR